jgi:hypothetical protein
MGMVQLRPGGGGSERGALRRGIAGAAPRTAFRVIDKGAPGPAFCAGCAAPIEFGQVIRGRWSYCSIECSLGGDRPA